MSGGTPGGRRIGRQDPLHGEVQDWLEDEAALLDRHAYREWLALLDEGLTYTAPTRSTVMRGGEGASSRRYGHFDETHASIAFRVERLCEPSAWAENPASRTRRFVTNVRVFADDPGEPVVQSYLLLLRNRGDDPHFDLVSCARTDRLRRDANGALLLAARRIDLDQATLGTANLAIFL